MWKRVTRQSPCRVCGKNGWCSYTNDCVKCMRKSDPVGGLKYVGNTKDGGHLFKEDNNGTEQVQGFAT